MNTDLDPPAAEGANLGVVRALFAGVARRDAAAVFAAFHPDAVIHEAPSLPYGGRYEGSDGLRRHAVAYTRSWDGLQDEAERDLDPRFFAAGDLVLVAWRQRAHRDDTGERFDQPVVSEYRLRDARIVESRMLHFDAAAVQRFLAAPPPASLPQA